MHFYLTVFKVCKQNSYNNNSLKNYQRISAGESVIVFVFLEVYFTTLPSD